MFVNIYFCHFKRHTFIFTVVFILLHAFIVDISIYTCYHYTSSNNPPILGVINVINNNILETNYEKIIYNKNV